MLSGGVVLTSVAGINDSAHASFLDSSGNLVVAGSALQSNGEYEFALLRYTPNGTLDSALGGDGVVTTSFSGKSWYDVARAAAAYPGGRIVIAGETGDYWTQDFALARYNHDGSLDGTFGPNGKVRTDLAGYDDRLNTLMVQPDGEIVVGGSTWPRGNIGSREWTLARYTASGQLDGSFGNGGVVQAPWAQSETEASWVTDVAFHQDKILALGSYSGANAGTVLVRYNLDGSLDTQFGAGGIATPGILPTHPAYWRNPLLIQGEKTVVAGRPPSGTYDIAVARLNSDGSVDTDFGQNGLAIMDPGYAEQSVALAAAPDGKIVVAAYTVRGGGDDPYEYYYTVARFNADGSLDDGSQYDTTEGDKFGDAGYVRTQILGYCVAQSVVVQGDGKITVTGYANEAYGSWPTMIALARYNPDGSLDETFGQPAPPPPGITVTPTSGLVTSEDGGTASFTVVLDSQPTADVTIPVSSSDTTEGMVSVSSLTFTAANWATPQTVTVTGVDDLDTDGNVAYTIVLGAASSTDPAYSALDAPDVSVTNLDNEGQSNVFVSEDVPKTIADPHPVKGAKPVTSQLVIGPTGITVDLIDVDVTIAHASMSDLTVTLKSPSNMTASLFYDGTDWNLQDAAAFSSQPLDGTWVLTVTDTVKNGISGTLTAWSITVTPQTQAVIPAGDFSSPVAATTVNEPAGSICDTPMLEDAIQDATDADTLFIEQHTASDDDPAWYEPSASASVDEAITDLDVDPLDDGLLENLVLAVL